MTWQDLCEIGVVSCDGGFEIFLLFFSIGCFWGFIAFDFIFNNPPDKNDEDEDL